MAGVIDVGALAFRTAIKAPTGLTATALNSTSIAVSWTGPSGFSVAAYELERSLDGIAGWTQIYSGTTASTTSGGLTPSTAYFYRVRLLDTQGNYSPYSSIATATTEADIIVTPGFDFFIGPSGNNNNAGSQGSPWALSALSAKAAQIAGKHIALLDGTYPITTAATLPVGASGTAGSYTIIEAVTPRGAVIDGGAGSSLPSGIWQGLVVNQAHFVKWRYLEIKRGVHKGFYSTGPHDLELDGLYIHDLLYSRQSGYISGDNTDAIRIGDTGAVAGQNENILITNCKLSDIYNNTSLAASSHNACGVKTYSTRTSVIVRQTTIFNTSCAVFFKESQSRVGIADRVYAHTLSQEPFLGPQAADSVGAVTQCIVRNGTNVGAFGGDADSLNNGTIDYSHCTFVAEDNDWSVVGGKLHCQKVNGARHWNNLYARLNGHAANDRGDLSINLLAAMALLDYNFYPASPRFQLVSTGYTTLSAWRTATGKEAGSQTGTPVFALTGSDAARFKLSNNGQAALTAGRVGGASSGTVVPVGAYITGTEQIGCDF